MRDCPYNEAIVCDSETCYHCGWYPNVMKAKAEVINEGQNLYSIEVTGRVDIQADSKEEALEKVKTLDLRFAWD